MSAGDENIGSGGVAAQIGIGYQNRVAAWMCVRILADRDVTPLWRLNTNITFDYIRCETGQPVDDILVGTSEGGHAFVNVKHTVTKSRGGDSALGSAIDQFVRQFLSYRGNVKGQLPWERQLDPKVDRLVLVTSSKSSVPIKQHLPRVLLQLRDLLRNGRIEAAATNQEEEEILTVVRGHVARVWREATGQGLAEYDELELLKLLWVETLDVEEDKAGEREAKDLLRAVVLNDPGQADAAWSALITACDGYASRQGGSDRSSLHQHLLTAGIRVKAPSSYRKDIAQLRAQSEQTLRALQELSTIRVGEHVVKIQRPSTQSLRSAVEQTSVVVVGEPGAGKSGAMHDLVAALLQEDKDVVFLAVDRLEARSLNALRQELNLEHDLLEVMKNWQDEGPAFLLIDALDAARSEASAQTFYDLISLTLQLPQRWHVVASIRRFDLRHHTRLQHLFEGRPPTEYSAAEFNNLIHFNVPLLSLEEWLQIPSQSSELAKLIAAAGENLRLLLRVPFNLRLAGELLGSGVTVESLTPIQTQIGLLDHYWQERIVDKDYESDAREAVLLRVVEVMVSARSLRVSRRDVADPSLSRALNQVLSAHVLIEWESQGGAVVDRSVLTFAHHVLFDYAAAYLLLRGTPQSLIQRLESDTDLVLAVRPSIVMHFQYLWLLDSATFWETYLLLLRSEQIPEIGKLVGASVAVEFMREVESFAPLMRVLSSEDVRQRELGEKAYRHVTGGLLVLAAPISITSVIGDTAPPWLELLDQCTATMSLSLVYSTRPVLWTVCGRSELFTDSQRYHAGRIARRLLEFALAHDPRDATMVIAGLETVCRTFESDPAASAVALRRCLEPQHVLAHGHEELFRLAQEVERLIPHDPSLVEEMFNAAFTQYDPSDEKTWAMASRILPLTSTRRQDFDMARLSFAGKYKQFLEAAPVNAARVVVNAMNTYVAERDEQRYLRLERVYGEDKAEEYVPYEERFEFAGQDAFIRPDYSEIWDNGGAHHNDEALKMLDNFQRYLEGLCEDEGHVDERTELLNLIVRENRNAVFWRRLLKIGTKHPDTLGHQIRSLAWAMPILMSYDTTRVVGDFISEIFSKLSDEERRQIEQTIVAIPAAVGTEQLEGAEHKRDRLLWCLAKDAVVTEEAKAILARLEAEKNAPSNEPLIRSGGVVSRHYTDEDYLRDQGVPVDEDQNRRVLELSQPAKTFATKYQNETPTFEDVTAIIPHLRSLHEALATAEADGVHERQLDTGWGDLANACAAVAKLEQLSCGSEDGEFIKAVLLEASLYSEPEPRPESYDHFDRHPSWGVPAARVDAAEGVILLASHQSCVDDHLLAAVERLVLRDPVPAVRFQVAIRLNTLYLTAPDLMWRLLETVSREEERRGILHFLLKGPLRTLAPYHPDRIAELTRNIFERKHEGAGADEVRKGCAALFLGLHMWQGQATCGDFIGRIADDPAEYIDEAHEIVFDMRSWFNLGLGETSKAEHDAIRTSSFRLAERILRSTWERLSALEKKYEGVPGPWPEEDQETGRNLARLAESVCMQIYFASGAYGRDNGDHDEEKIPMGAEARSRFLREANGILYLLAEFGHASLTHHLMQTLEFLIQYDPKNVFLLVGTVVRSGKRGGYQYESLAIDLIVKLVERFIAEFRYILQESEECRRVLIEILDVFVEAGWPSARRVTYRIEEIFR
jgi:DNA replication protein DnaC